ncbi:MAG: hypothetical protein N3H31_07305 [Candidatus Nezhaarchaeota archaeon]|nr:hypothetical protein [Candidatus Nezhaarchaeota archaeon]
MLRIRVRLLTEKSVEALAIANSGFIGSEPEVLIPLRLVKQLYGESPSVTLVERVLADGSRTLLAKCTKPLGVYVVTEDRVVGPVEAYAYASRAGFVLLNDKLLGRLGVAIIDPGEGLWCFRDEVGSRVRRGV